MPANFKAEVYSSTEISLVWDNNDTEATGLQLERSLNGTNYTIVDNLPSNTTSYLDSSLGIGVVYGYRLCALKNDEVSEYIYSEVLATHSESLLPNVASMPGSKITVQYEGNNSERSSSAIDDDITTKYRFTQRSGWLKVELPQPYKVNEYAIVAANDAADRDPKSWTLQASDNTDGPWVTLDTRQDQFFISRFCPLRFRFANDTEYKFYRLNITANNGNNSTQLADFKLLAERDIEEMQAEAIADPSNFRATVNAHHLVTLRWNDNANNEDTYVVQRSTDGINWDWEKKGGRNYTQLYSHTLKGNTTYYYRLRAENQYNQSNWVTLESTTVTTPSDEIPESIQEHWFEHQDLVYLKAKDEEVAIYYDPLVDQSIEWPLPFFSDTWKYIKSVYGDFSDPILYVILHADGYYGGHPATWGSQNHDYRNIIDNGLSGNDWKTVRNGFGIPVHEISHIIEGGSHLMLGSPEASRWGDSKFAEIFIYDVCLALSELPGDPYGMKAIAKEQFNLMMLNNDSSVPKPGCYWFRDFYYPIYTRFGGSKMLADFFTLMYQHYPKKNLSYVGGMNYGEFFHFYSGACGVDIKEYAEKAFGWSPQWEFEYKQAQVAYPIDYSSAPDKITQNGGEIIAEYPIRDTDPLTDPSLLIDGNLNTKYRRLVIGADSYWVQYNSPVSYKLSGYSLTSGDDYPNYDPKDWTLSGSNDGGQTWQIIDTRTDFLFSSRSKTDYFELASDEAYKSFRLNVTGMSGEGAKTVQLAEWQLEGFKSPVENPPLQIKPVNSKDVIVSSSKNNITIQSHSDEVTWYRIFDVSGQLVADGKIPSGTVVSENCNASGIYLVSLLLPSNKISTNKVLVNY